MVILELLATIFKLVLLSFVVITCLFFMWHMFPTVTAILIATVIIGIAIEIYLYFRKKKAQVL